MGNQDDLNGEEFCMLASGSIIECPSIVEEKFTLSAIGQSGGKHSYIENMYGYTDERGDHYMVAAVIGSVGEDGTNKYSLVGSTGTSYWSTQELKVMNYHEAMKTINKSDWLKAICVEHEKMKK